MKWIYWIIITGLTVLAIILSIKDNGFDNIVALGTVFLLLATIIVTRIVLSKTSKKKQ